MTKNYGKVDFMVTGELQSFIGDIINNRGHLILVDEADTGLITNRIYPFFASQVFYSERHGYVYRHDDGRIESLTFEDVPDFLLPSEEADYDEYFSHRMHILFFKMVNKVKEPKMK